MCIRDRDEDTDRIHQQLPHTRGALHVNFENKVSAGGRFPYDLLFRRTVEVTVHTRPFQEFTCPYHLVESLTTDKEILAAIDFTLPWRTSRVRDRIAKIIHNIQHVSNDGAFAATRLRADDEESASRRRVIDWSCQLQFFHFTRHSDCLLY